MKSFVKELKQANLPTNNIYTDTINSLNTKESRQFIINPINRYSKNKKSSKIIGSLKPISKSKKEVHLNTFETNNYNKTLQNLTVNPLLNNQTISSEYEKKDTNVLIEKTSFKKQLIFFSILLFQMIVFFHLVKLNFLIIWLVIKNTFHFLFFLIF